MNAKKIVEDLLEVVDMLMPGVGKIAIQDYALLNNAPIEAKKFLEQQISTPDPTLKADPQASFWFPVVLKAAETFRDYEKLHRAKGTEDGLRKAERNREMAEDLETLLGGGK